MRILVTGATGLIGRHLIERLAPRHELVCISRSDPPAEIATAADWIRVDLAEPIDVAELPGSVEGIVHLAQSDRYREFPEGADDLFAVNVRSTMELLEYGRRIEARAFVLASTGGCYAPGTAALSEGARLEPPGPYFRSKRAAELLAENYAELLGGAILRLFFVYGPGKGARLVTRLAKQISDGEEVLVAGEPGMRMNPIFAADAAAAIEAALGLQRQEVVNIAGTEVVTVSDLAARLGRAMGREPVIRHAGEATGDLVADTTRMQERLGVVPAISLDDGLAAVAEWIGATRSPASRGA
jgi:nucleoside-diphosphate-sugar epimerase